MRQLYQVLYRTGADQPPAPFLFPGLDLAAQLNFSWRADTCARYNRSPSRSFASRHRPCDRPATSRTNISASFSAHDDFSRDHRTDRVQHHWQGTHGNVGPSGPLDFSRQLYQVLYRTGDGVYIQTASGAQGMHSRPRIKVDGQLFETDGKLSVVMSRDQIECIIHYTL